MSGLTITTLAQQIEDLIGKSEQQTKAVTAWLGGSADGGPNNDGRYPFVDLGGREILVPSPASFSDMTSGPAAQASVAKVAAELARDLAKGHADRSDAQRILSEAARGAAVDARNLAQEHRNHAGTHEANSRYWAEQAQGSGQSTSADREIVEQLAGEVADNAALVAQDTLDAAASAALAATFDPNLFDKKSDTLASSRLEGMIDPARIPVLVGQTPVVSNGGITNLTTVQQNGIRPGTLVATMDGRRWVYSGSGAKNVEANYIEQGDVTPVWSVIADKPSFFPSNIVNVAGLQSALDGKSNLGHGHVIADVANLQAALDARSLTGHVHAWTTITDGPTIFPSDIANVSGLQAALSDRGNLAGGNSWTGSQTFNGGITVKDSLTMTGADPYLRRDSNSAAWVLAGGQGWTNTGAVIVLHGKDHSARPGDMLLYGVDGNATSNLHMDGWKTITMNRRPTFAGATPWDSSNLPTPAQTGAAQTFSATQRIQTGGNVSTGNFGNGSVELTVASFHPRIAFEDRTTNAKNVLLAWDGASSGGSLRWQFDAAGDGTYSDTIMRLDVTSRNLILNGGTVWHSGLIASPIGHMGSLAQEDLNTITTTGFYHQNSNANATAAANYPMSKAGLLEISNNGGMIYQRYTGYRAFPDSYTRNQYGGIWGPWYKSWTSYNFNPDAKVSWTDTNMDGGAYTVVRRNGDGGGFFTGRLHAYSQTATNDVWNGGIEIQEVKNVGNTQGSHAYAPALTFHWKNVAARSVYMNSGGWICFGQQGDKEASLAGIKASAIGTTSNAELHLKWNEDTKMRTHQYGVAVSGNCDVENGGIFVRSNAPTITLQDSDHRSAMIHVNNSRFYVLRGSGTNATGWESVNGGWPLELNLDNGDLRTCGQIYTGNNSWVRVVGSGNGIYWENHGGGWFMQDASWMRAYNDKNIVTGGQVQMGSFTVTSDRRLKTDIVPIPLAQASDIIDATNVYEFTKCGRRMFGMIAQEAREVAPILVSEGADIHEDGDAILSLDQTGYIPVLIAEVRSLRQRIARLEGVVQ